MSDYQQFGFGDNDGNIGKKGRRLKMDKNELTRISFLLWPGLDKGEPDLDAKSPGFIAADRLFIKGVGYVLARTPDFTKIAGEAPKKRINTIIVKWPLDKNGQIDSEGIKDGEYEVMFWVFDPNKYDELKPIHSDWHFGSHDLKIKCTDAGFQKMSFSPCPDNVFRRFLDRNPKHELVLSIIEAARNLLPLVRDELGKDMTLDQIREKMTGGSGGGGSPSAPVEDSAVTEDIDSALSDLFDD